MPRSKSSPAKEARSLAKLDHAYVWHPFTQMRDWLAREPIVLTR